MLHTVARYPWGDSNARTRLRRPLLYPLSYRGSQHPYYHNLTRFARRIRPALGQIEEHPEGMIFARFASDAHVVDRSCSASEDAPLLTTSWTHPSQVRPRGRHGVLVPPPVKRVTLMRAPLPGATQSRRDIPRQRRQSSLPLLSHRVCPQCVARWTDPGHTPRCGPGPAG